MATLKKPSGASAHWSYASLNQLMNIFSLQPTVCIPSLGMSHEEDVLPAFRNDIVVKYKSHVFGQHSTTREADAFHRVEEKVKLAESIVASEHFVPNDEGLFCKSCPFQGPCSKWHRERSRLISVATAAPESCRNNRARRHSATGAHARPP